MKSHSKKVYPRSSEVSSDTAFSTASSPAIVASDIPRGRSPDEASYIAPIYSDEEPELSTTGTSPLEVVSPGDSDDEITDTVGAVAIDCYGNVACGASSGGIGMKYRGRIGPAALVGVGTAVIPVEAGDKSRTCVATVTSGTGEHMATTMAATVCAERVYHGKRKSKNGFEDTDDDTAVRSMIEDDFMGECVKLFLSSSHSLLSIICHSTSTIQTDTCMYCIRAPKCQK